MAGDGGGRSGQYSSTLAAGGRSGEQGGGDEAGAVGELTVDLLHATGLVTETQARLANLAPLLLFALAVGDGDEVRGEPFSASAARQYVVPAASAAARPLAETTRIELRQRLVLPVHDSLTQRLKMRVLIKEPIMAKELTVLASAELSLADLRLGTVAAKRIPLTFGGGAIWHCCISR